MVLANITDFDRAIGDGSRGAGSFQGDAIRNITGEAQMPTNSLSGTTAPVRQGSGAVDTESAWGGNLDSLTWSSTDRPSRKFSFDASRVVPTIATNDPTGSRPNNVAYHKCIYHGRYF